MVDKTNKTAASPVDTQGDAAASTNMGTNLATGSESVPPSPDVVTRSHARAASESPSKLVGSPKKLAASRKTGAASAGRSACVPARASQVAAMAPQAAVSAGARGVVPLRPHADSSVDVD